ncbi:MAG TPA: GTP pyrophosphokinase family protein [Candidatus Choladousia intestinavium]|uniref:GTP pyrophosphokinase family protein n=1 Tax=Candidatus Choladousia intestinavium TaxID=2840727 RepID=A0A9D1ABN8_9FIRM|nr:GTP pyrophosphokinase family protein [Candidatus Choladousia intestinavium]
MEKVEETLEEYQYIRVLESGRRFMEIMNKYRCAIMEVETKLNVLNSEFSLQYDRNPFESIKTRLKSPRSIIEKLRRRGFSLADGNVEELVEENLYDVAGVRVICAFQEDIYRLADLLLQQDDIRLIRTKDYIKNPKPNGYRSLHLILEVPVFLEKGKTPVKIEVQFRTIAMDFWASVDHKLRYKKNVEDEEKIVEKLRQCAETISTLDDEMQRIRNMIEAGGERHVKD